MNQEVLKRRDETLYKTAMYLRLSRDDGDKNESDSITNQRKLIQDYIEDKSEYHLVDEYVDDGYSGSNFERPGWKQLYEDLERGAVNCIIVKDLSRFGRNYIEVGRYLQMIFPVLGVRLVAINDNFDTLNEWRNGDALTVPMKNLINDIYCRDISKKITTQLEAMRKRGECISPFVPYGYRKDPNNHLKLVVDNEAAENVKQIFSWKLEGYSDRIIANMLNEKGVLSPYEYHISKGEHVSGNFKTHDKAAWSSGSVYNVLHNECYTGTIVQGKWRRLDYRSKERVLLPKKEWTRVEGTHEAIVDKELFMTVQELMKRNTRIAGGRTKVELLSGFLFCGECGRQLTLKPAYRNGKKYQYYECRDCSSSGIKSPRISKKNAYAKVLNVVNKVTQIADIMDDVVNEGKPKIKECREVIRLDEDLAKLQEEIERYDRLKNGLYEDYSNGILNREEYMDYSLMYKSKIDKAKKEACIVEEKRIDMISNYNEARWIRTFKRYVNLTGLERPILAELIERVDVYRDGQIDVVFKEKDAIRSTLEIYDCDNLWEEILNEQQTTTEKRAG